MSNKREKIGVGIITYNRPNYLYKLLNTLPSKHENKIDHLVIINDGKPITDFDLSFGKLINNEVNLGVGKSKNKAMQYLLDKGCEYIFIIEDDTIIKDIDIFTAYIDASKTTGIQHFNFGPGTPFNRKQTIVNYDLHNRELLDNNSKPNPKLTIEYNNKISIDLYEHVAGVFSFFTKAILQSVGLHDERYKNAWEHVDHTFKIIKKNGHPPFWWFADIHNSVNYLEIPDEAIKDSSTSNNKGEWFKNINAGREIYKHQHGFYPNMCPHTSKEDVINNLKNIKSKWTI